MLSLPASSFAAVAFGGSRSLASSPVVVPVVAAVLGGGARVSVGCCVGADALVVSAALGCRPARWSQVSVLAAFGPGGAGSAGALSSVAGVAAAAQFGASVAWWAGGGPAVPLRARLAQRSAAVVAGAAAAGRGALVLFSPGAGSLAAALPAAVRLAVPVFVFAPAAPSALPFAAGSFAGFPCWAWAPGAAPASQLALF